MKDLSTQEVAERLGVHEATVNVWVNQGEFPNAYKLNPNKRNSPRRIPESDVEEFERRRQTGHQ